MIVSLGNSPFQYVVSLQMLMKCLVSSFPDGVYSGDITIHFFQHDQVQDTTDCVHRNEICRYVEGSIIQLSLLSLLFPLFANVRANSLFINSTLLRSKF